MGSEAFGQTRIPEQEERCFLCARQAVEHRPLPLCGACKRRVNAAASRTFMSTMLLTVVWLSLARVAVRYFELLFYPALIGAAFVWLNGVLLVAAQMKRRWPPLFGDILADNCTFGVVLAMACWAVIELVIAVAM